MSRLRLTLLVLLIAALALATWRLLSAPDEIIRSLRLWRLGAAALTGAALGAAGVLSQGLFRNALAAPSIIGASGGAMLGGQVALLLVAGSTAASSELLRPFGCLCGAAGSLLVLLALTKRMPGPLTVILTGFLLSSLALGFGALLTAVAMADHALGRAVIAFTLGGVDTAGRDLLTLTAPLLLVGVLGGLLCARPLDLLATGTDEARSLGLDLPALRLWTLVWIAVLTGGAVALAGGVAFVGLIAPHAARAFSGVQHRRLLPLAALLGAVFVMACDSIAAMRPFGTGLPLGVLTSLIGAPLFLALLLRLRGREVLA